MITATTERIGEQKSMKSIIMVLVLGLVSLWTGISGMAQPAVGDSISGATVNETTTKPAKKLASNGFVGGVVRAYVIPVRGNPLNSGNGWIEHIVFEEDFLAGIHEWVPTIKGPVSWKDMIYATANGKIVSSWNIVQQLIYLESIDGSDSINLAMFSLEARESPTGMLSDVYEISATQGYSPAAVGFKADGTKITGGSADQMVAKIILVVQMRLFSGGATKAGLDEVRNWILSRDKFTVTYKVAMEGREVQGGEASITVQKPYLTITENSVTLEGDEKGILYDIQYSDPVNGQWRNLTTAYAGDRNPIVPTGKARFFRAVSRE